MTNLVPTTTTTNQIEPNAKPDIMWVDVSYKIVPTNGVGNAEQGETLRMYKQSPNLFTAKLTKLQGWRFALD